MERRLDRLLADSSAAERVDGKTVEWRDLSVDTETVDGSNGPDESLLPDGTTRAGSTTATLVAVEPREIQALAYTHQLETLAEPPSARRLTAHFEITNTGSQPVHWLGSRTTAVGTDGTEYRQAAFDVDMSKLTAGWQPKQAVIEPQRTELVITPLEQLPPDVGISRIVQTIASSDPPEIARLEFSVD